MRIRSLVIALTFLAAFAPDSWGQSKRLPAKSQQEQAQPAAPDQRGTEQSPLIVRVTPTPKTDAEREGEAKERERAAKAQQWKEKSDADLVRYTAELASFTKWLFAATVVLFLATLGLAGAAIVQSRDMKASVEVNRTAAIAALRQANAIVAMESPIPGIVELKLVEYADEYSDVALTDPVHGVPPPFCRPLVNLQNRGRTELTVHRFCCDWIVAPAVEEVPYYQHVESWNGALPMESSVWVKSQNGIRLYQEEARTIGDFAAFLWVYGYFTYSDFMGVCHRLHSEMGHISRLCARAARPIRIHAQIRAANAGASHADQRIEYIRKSGNRFSLGTNAKRLPGDHAQTKR